jgi:hypothetical protein
MQVSRDFGISLYAPDWGRVTGSAYKDAASVTAPNSDELLHLWNLPLSFHFYPDKPELP